jgi:cell division protein FtsB
MGCLLIPAHNFVIFVFDLLWNNTMKKRNNWLLIILAFLLGILVCHLFYYSNSYLSDRRLQSEIESLKEKQSETQQELDKIDSLLNQIP